MSPLISVVIVNYNMSEFLGQCINSILAQTYPNIEIVFCDDASTDGSVELFDKIIQNCKRVEKGEINRQIKTQNEGYIKNSLNGLQNFEGEYVCKIDSDDVFSKYHLEILHNLAQKYNVDISITNHKEIYSDEDCQIAEKPSVDEVALLTTKDCLPTFFFGEQKVPFAFWHQLHKRDVAKKILEIPSEFILNGDSVLSVCAFANAKTVAFLDTPTYFYRIRASSASHKSWHFLLRNETFASIDKICDFYHTKELYELNTQRNLHTIAEIFKSSITEALGYREFLDCFKKYVTNKNRNKILSALFPWFSLLKLSKISRIKKGGLLFSWRFTPKLVYLAMKRRS